MAQRTPRCFEAQSVSRFEDSGAQAAVSSEDGPSEVEDHEVRGCIKGVGARAIRSPCMSGRSSQEGQDGEFSESRDTSSRPPEVSCGSECSARGFFGSLGARRCRRTESSRGRVGEGPCTSYSRSSEQRMDECEKYYERAAKRLEKAKESVGKVQTQREEELAEGKRRMEVLRAEVAAQPVPHPTIPGHVAQLEGDLRQSHRLVTEEISTEISLKERIEFLMQEVAALKVRVPVSGSGGPDTALVPVSRTGSALMSDFIEEADKKRPRVTEGGSGPCAS